MKLRGKATSQESHESEREGYESRVPRKQCGSALSANRGDRSRHAPSEKLGPPNYHLACWPRPGIYGRS